MKRCCFLRMLYYSNYGTAWQEYILVVCSNYIYNYVAFAVLYFDKPCTIMVYVNNLAVGSIVGLFSNLQSINIPCHTSYRLPFFVSSVHILLFLSSCSNYLNCTPCSYLSPFLPLQCSSKDPFLLSSSSKHLYCQGRQLHSHLQSISYNKLPVAVQFCPSGSLGPCYDGWQW